MRPSIFAARGLQCGLYVPQTPSPTPCHSDTTQAVAQRDTVPPACKVAMTVDSQRSRPPFPSHLSNG